MMFRRIDRWIGRHMNAKRWAIVWMMVSWAGVGITATGRMWGLVLCLLSVLMMLGNLRRLR